jgi:hypothetical protein
MNKCEGEGIRCKEPKEEPGVRPGFHVLVLP